MIRPTLVALIIICLFATSARAQDNALCPEIPDGDQLTIEGVGVVRASSLDSENGFTKFINGCFEQGDWALEAPVLTLEEATNTLSAQNAKIRSRGARGTVQNVVAKEENIMLETLVLAIDGSYKRSGLPSGTYNIKAERGVLKGQDLTLSNSVIDKTNGGQVTQRFSSTSAIFKNDTLVVTGLRNATSNLVVNATDATIQNGSATAQTVTGSLGRVSKNSDFTFSAAQALSNDSGVVTLLDAEIKIFGIPIRLASYTYDPAAPYDFSIVIGFGAGLDLGISNLRILTGEEGRLTLVGKNLFSSTTATTLTLFMRGVKEGWTYFVGQDDFATTYNSFRFFLERDPNTGFTLTFNFDTGRRIADPSRTRSSGDERVGYALGGSSNTDFGIFNYRAKLEYGHVWQDDVKTDGTTSTVEINKAQNQTFFRFAPILNWNTSIASFSFRAAAGVNFTWYAFQKTNDQFILNANSSFNISYAVKIAAQNWGSISSGISWLEAFGTNVFARYAITPITQFSIGLVFAPPVGTTPALGFQGVNFRNPQTSLLLVIDLRKAFLNNPQPFVNQIVRASFDLDFYDGIVLKDNFDNPFQTPNFSLTPALTYDFITQKGEIGSSITLYSSSFGFTFGLYLTQQNLSETSNIRTASTGFRFSFGLRFR